MNGYHHGNLRATLVQEAAELARLRGPDGVVLREVARRAGVSHNAAYRHFADRDALLAEVADAGMARLEAAMRAQLDAVTETEPLARAIARLRATGRAYVDFALDEPGMFEVAFSVAAHDDVAAKQMSDEPPGPYAQLLAALDDLVAVGVLPAERRDGAAVACWAGVHGFAVLHLRGPLVGVPPQERDAALGQLLDVLQAGLS